MPFGLTNAPAVFQRLMQSVLMGLNPVDGNQFVSVYIDDVLLYSRTLPEHLEHLESVTQRIEQASLKLKPSRMLLLSFSVLYSHSYSNSSECSLANIYCSADNM